MAWGYSTNNIMVFDSVSGTIRPSAATVDANGNISSSVIPVTQLSTTGTPSASTYLRGDGTWSSPSGAGTVTSVGLTGDGTVLVVSGSPITSSGSFGLSFAAQAANLVFAGPASGSALAPTYRALVSLDLPQSPTLTGTITGATLTSTGAINAGTNKFTINSSGLMTIYNGLTLAGNGHPVVMAVVDLTGQVATLTSQTLLASGSVVTGMYRLTGYIKKTTAATTSSTTGPLTVTYADGTDSTSLTPTIAFLTSAGAIATSNANNVTTVTGSNTIVPQTFYAKAGTAITYTLTYASSGTTAMAYELHLRLELL